MYMIAEPANINAVVNIHFGPYLSINLPTPIATNPPTNVPRVTANATVERVQPNSSVMGFRKTPIVGFIRVPYASPLNATTETITQP